MRCICRRLWCAVWCNVHKIDCDSLPMSWAYRSQAATKSPTQTNSNWRRPRDSDRPSIGHSSMCSLRSVCCPSDRTTVPAPCQRSNFDSIRWPHCSHSGHVYRIRRPSLGTSSRQCADPSNCNIREGNHRAWDAIWSNMDFHAVYWTDTAIGMASIASCRPHKSIVHTPDTWTRFWWRIFARRNDESIWCPDRWRLPLSMASAPVAAR